jgi:hypothetical protein
MFSKKEKKIDHMQLLTFAASDVEACVIQGLLESFGIFTYLDYEGDVGSLKVIIGNTNLGVNIYVKIEDYESAKEILETGPPAGA